MSIEKTDEHDGECNGEWDGECNGEWDGEYDGECNYWGDPCEYIDDEYDKYDEYNDFNLATGGRSKKKTIGIKKIKKYGMYTQKHIRIMHKRNQQKSGLYNKT